MKKNYFIIIGGAVLFLWFLWQVFNPPKDYPDPNTYYFDGKITSIIQSGNHAFSIYVVKLDTVHVTVLDSNYFSPKKSHYPAFRYKGNLGEVYTIHSLEDSVGYRIKSNVVDSSIEIINNKGQVVSTASTFLVTELPNIEFIKKHSRIR